MHQQHSTTVSRAAGTTLPLVAMEHYMLADDRVDYPMVFYARLSLTGLPQRDAFERAVAAAVKQHPLLSATLGPADGRRRNWVWDRLTQAEIIWPGEPARQDPLDLGRQPGLRIRVEQVADGARLMLEFHHACCDGLGAAALIHDLLEAYAAEIAQAGASEKPSLDAAWPNPDQIRRLRTRGRCGVGPLRFLLRLPLELLGALGIIEFLWHRPEAVSGSRGMDRLSESNGMGGSPTLDDTTSSPPRAENSPAGDAATNPSPQASCPGEAHEPLDFSHAFSVEETRMLRQAASAAGATLNDLLVRDLFLTLGQWIDEHRPSPRGAHVPRDGAGQSAHGAEKNLSAANVVAMINLDRRPRRWRNHRRMLRVLHWEMAAVKWARAGLTFIRAIQVTHYWLGKLHILLAADKCQATCVLTNLGDPWRNSPLAGPDGRVVAGDMTVRQIVWIAPLRPLTSVAIAVMTYAGRLTLALRGDRRVLTPEECQALLNRLVARLQAAQQQDQQP